MGYIPYQKTVTFNEDIRNHIKYPVAMKVVKAIADKTFKDWFVKSLQKCLQEASDDDFLNDVRSINNSIEGLVSRAVQVERETLNEASKVLYPSPDTDAIKLLSKILGSLYDIQNFERKLREIEKSTPQEMKGALRVDGGSNTDNLKPRRKQSVRYK